MGLHVYFNRAAKNLLLSITGTNHGLEKCSDSYRSPFLAELNYSSTRVGRPAAIYCHRGDEP